MKVSAAPLVAALCASQPSLRELKKLFPASWQQVHQELVDLAHQPHPDLLAQKLKQACQQWDSQGQACLRLKEKFEPQKAQEQATLLIRKLALAQFCREFTQHTLNTQARQGLLDRLLFKLLILPQATAPRALPRRRHEWAWRLLRNRAAAAVALHQAGCYTIFPAEFVAKLLAWTEGHKVLEIGAGRGLLSRYLTELKQEVVAVDDYSWQDKIPMGRYVLCLEGTQALKQYTPEVVISCWPPPGNRFEAAILNTATVQTYITIVSRHPEAAGNRRAYRQATAFSCFEAPVLNALLLPQEAENVIYIFTRKR